MNTYTNKTMPGK